MGKVLTDAEIIEKLLPAIKENANSFSKALGYKRAASIYNITKGDARITTGMAKKIVEVFPEVNYLFVTLGQLPIKIDQSKAIGQNHILKFTKNTAKFENIPQLLSDILKEIKGLREDLKKH
ncbi:hypothetical protein [Thalassobellus suaedae]|uniref:HTH cro/C1-type domain-containing protein n=1 Tax=Thalassobellus suaedae TaxID=3074124 RepID=A0ABY9XVW1_9FLAO|nr:hypothetical protein RHP51_05155 [Flavobacteriaceae bacterium HL-DH14]